MAWLAVSKNNFEYIYHNKPVRKDWGWQDDIFYDEYRACSTNAEDGSIRLPSGSIKKLTGKELTWKDQPVELKNNLLDTSLKRTRFW